MLVGHLSGGELTEYADGEMAGARRRWAQQHLSRCERCTKALGAIWEAVAALPIASEAAFPGDLRARIAARVCAGAIRPISCRDARELIQRDLDGDLSPLPAGLLRLHLDGCPACREQQATLAATAHLVRSLRPVSAPRGLWEQAIAGRRLRPAVSWGVRLRPALAAVAMAAGALILGLYSLPERGARPVTRRSRPQVASHPAAARPGPVEPVKRAEPVEVQPVPAPVSVAGGSSVVSPRAQRPRAAAVSPRRLLEVVREAAAPITRPSPASPVIRIVSSRGADLPRSDKAAVQARTSRGLQALAMMAKAVSSESEGRVSLTRELEPWQVFRDETVSEEPLGAPAPAEAPGTGPSTPSAQPNRGARDVRPGRVVARISDTA